MDGRAWFVVTAFLMAAVVVLSNANCGYDDSWSPQQRVVGGTDPLAAEMEPVEGRRTVNELCLAAAPESGKEVIFAAPDSYDDYRTCEENGMQETAASLYLSILENEPQEVAVYGRPSVQYCFLVLRKSGYITISHPNGEVHREGDRFTWCVVPADENGAETMAIRSLTARAEVEVSVL